MPFKIIRDDITKIKCDAIVNPSNSSLLPGGGTDAAIHEAAGEKLLSACKELGGCPVGEARITPAYKLPQKYVIHTVGPVWHGGTAGEERLLESCYRESLTLAKRYGCKSVAIPLISSGTHGYPKDRVLKAAISSVGEFLFENEMTVYIVVFDKTSYRISEKLFSDVTAFIDDFYVDEHLDGIDLYREERIFENAGAAPHTPRGRARQDELSALCEKRRLAPRSDIVKMMNAEPCLDDMIRSMDKGFAEMLFKLIDERGISDVECYKRANVDKKTFSKIKCNKNYKPSKVTVISFAIALKLSLEETNRLLRTVGFSLSRSNKFDIIIEYFISNGNYDIFEINETLFEFDQLLLGC